MTVWGQCNSGGNVIQDKNSYPAIVISSGGSMLCENTDKNRYSFEEPRNDGRVEWGNMREKRFQQIDGTGKELLEMMTVFLRHAIVR